MELLPREIISQILEFIPNKKDWINFRKTHPRIHKATIWRDERERMIEEIKYLRQNQKVYLIELFNEEEYPFSLNEFTIVNSLEKTYNKTIFEAIENHEIDNYFIHKKVFDEIKRKEKLYNVISIYFIQFFPLFLSLIIKTQNWLVNKNFIFEFYLIINGIIVIIELKDNQYGGYQKNNFYSQFKTEITDKLDYYFELLYHRIIDKFTVKFNRFRRFRLF